MEIKVNLFKTYCYLSSLQSQVPIDSDLFVFFDDLLTVIEDLIEEEEE